MFSLFGILLGIGSMPILSLYRFITTQVGSIACSSATDYMTGSIVCVPAVLVAIPIAGTLTVMYIFACIEWWTRSPLTGGG
jgi:hypothetical protein